MDYNNTSYKQQANYILGILRNRITQQGDELPEPKIMAHIWGQTMLLLNKGMAGSQLGKLAAECNDADDYFGTIEVLKQDDDELHAFQEWREKHEKAKSKKEDD